MIRKEQIPQVRPWLDQDDARAVAEIMETSWITEGEAATVFSVELNKLIGAPYGVFAPNGTLALALGLMALGLRPGDEVIVPDITFIGSATAVILAGGVPVFVDVEPATYQIDVAQIEARLSPRTRALMPVHLFGTACDMDAVLEVSRKHGLCVIEDAAQGVGVTYRGRHVGAMGDVGCFSFFADKTITTGEGGYVTCQDLELYERLLHLRNQGRVMRGGLVPFRCVIMGECITGLQEHLTDRGIESRLFFYPLHKQPCFKDLAQASKDEDFPNAVQGSQQGLCLPIFPTLEPDQVRRISLSIREFYKSR